MTEKCLFKVRCFYCKSLRRIKRKIWAVEELLFREERLMALRYVAQPFVLMTVVMTMPLTLIHGYKHVC